MGPLGHSAAALSALIGAPFLLAAAARPTWREGWRERLGAAPSGPGGAIWVHTASVGEARAAAAFVDRLAESAPVFVSTRTATGRAIWRSERPALPCALAPLDHPWCVAAALARVRPRALVLVETEIWPLWIRAAHARGVPILVVSGRLSDRSFGRYRRAGRLLRATLDRLSAVGARSALDAERFVALGARHDRVSITGDLKLEPAGGGAPLAPELRAALGATRLLVAGSTHAGEEEAALDALDAAESAGHRVALVPAPRHPRRAGDVLEVARRRGRSARCRSGGGDPLGPGEVLVLDTLGELSSVYELASVAFVGGTLVPIGGHNLLEPLFAGRRVLFGPHTESQRVAAELLLRSGAGTRVADAAGLAHATLRMLGDPEAARAGVADAHKALEAHRGTAERSAALVRAVLGAPAAAA